MKVLGIFGFFLTIGILGSTVTEALKIAAQSDILDYLIRDHVEPTCRRNAGPKAFEAFENSCDTIQECMANMTMEINKVNDDILRSTGKWPLQVLLQCNHLPVLRECLEPHIEITKACSDPAEKNFIDISMKIFNEFVASTCNNPQKFEKLTNHGSTSCLNSKYRELLMCAEDVVEYAAAAVLNHVFEKMHGEREAQVPLLIGSSCSLDGCQILETYETCSLKVLNECEEKVPAEVLAILFEDINPLIPCKNLIKSRP